MGDFHEERGEPIPINLGRREGRERPKTNAEKLKSLMKNTALEINRDAEEQHGIKGLVNSDGSLAMEGYAKSRGGIYSDAEIERNKDDVRLKEIEFSGANNPNVQAFYHTEYGVDTQEGLIQRWRENKAKAKNAQTEMAVTAILHKFLKKDFLVVRTSVYDDYEHGADNLILDKRTGAVICAFDEVHEGGQGQRTAEKMRKIRRIARNGGTKIRYGIGLDQGRLRRSAIENVPVFYLGLKSEELEELLRGMDYNPDSTPTRSETKVFSLLIASLREQKALIDNPETSPAVMRKLKAFESSFAVMERVAKVEPVAA